MLKFNNAHIITGQIKQLLNDFHLPKMKIWKPGIPSIKNIYYLKDNQIKLGKGDNQWETISPYIVGQPYLNLTRKYTIDSLYYDSKTHKYLGDYLRFQRDVLGLNLMSMYNCYANETAKNVNIKVGSASFNTLNDNFKIFMVPVKVGEIYTIGIDSDSSVELIVGIYSEGNIIEPATPTLYNNTYQHQRSSHMSQPFLYTKLKDVLDISTQGGLRPQLLMQEENLTLFIKTKATSNSTLTVLEGDFTKHAELHFKDDKELSFMSSLREITNYEIKGNDIMAKSYITRPQLLAFNSGESYPFADRLIEYLFDNVITKNDSIGENIARVQYRLVERQNSYRMIDKSEYQFLTVTDGVNSFYVLNNGNTLDVKAPGAENNPNRLKIHTFLGMPSIVGNANQWSTKLRNVLHDIGMTTNTTSQNKYDVLGYVDKDIERILG